VSCSPFCALPPYCGPPGYITVCELFTVHCTNIGLWSMEQHRSHTASYAEPTQFSVGYLINKAWGGVWYMGNIPRPRAVLGRNAIPQPPEVPYCYYKLVTNVIRAVKKKCHTRGIWSDIPQLSASQHSGLKPPSL
jgi:hypothetical protein